MKFNGRVRNGPAFFVSKLSMAAIHVESWMVPKIPRCTVDILSQILYYKTQDGGKTFTLHINPLS